MELSFEDIGFLLLYFPSDCTFSISPVSETSWSQDIYSSLLLQKANFKVRIQAEYDGLPYSAIIIQCAKVLDDLTSVLNYVIRLKAEKKLTIENILPKISRFVSGSKRNFLPALKVSMGGYY
jgi:hypothetical protein